VRRLGFLLLFIGFAWLNLQQINVVLRTELRSVGQAEFAKLSADPDHKYTEQDVRTRIIDTAVAVHARFPVVLAPGVLLLAGGLILAFASRRKQAQSAA
jgi:hypothetical protein